MSRHSPCIARPTLLLTLLLVRLATFQVAFAADASWLTAKMRRG